MARWRQQAVFWLHVVRFAVLSFVLAELLSAFLLLCESLLGIFFWCGVRTPVLCCAVLCFVLLGVEARTSVKGFC